MCEKKVLFSRVAFSKNTPPKMAAGALTEEDWQKMKLPELKEELTKRGLATNGVYSVVAFIL